MFCLVLSKPLLIESRFGLGILITLLAFQVILSMRSISASVVLSHIATRQYRKAQPMVKQ